MADFYKIPEISKKVFAECVKPIYEVLEQENESTTSDDVFLKAVVMGFSDSEQSSWENLQKARLSEKVLTMKMGYFHQNLMGKFPGYETLPHGHSSGLDVSSESKNIVIEVKNRHNTMNSSSAKSTFDLLKCHADEGKRAILVQVNCPNGRVNRYKAHESVEVWNGKQAYAFLSGRDSFFDDLEKTMKHVFAAFKTYEDFRSILETP